MAKPRKSKPVSTGPVTTEGKARSSLNAVKHGARSNRLLLPYEDGVEYEQLMRDLALDLRPVGTIEHILIEKIAAILWKKRRLEGAEQHMLLAARMRPVTDAELKDALGLTLETLPPWMKTVDTFGVEAIASLPEWMLKENVPDEAKGKKAVELGDEWQQASQGLVAETEAAARKQFPATMAHLTAELKEAGAKDAKAYLAVFYEADDFLGAFPVT